MCVYVYVYIYAHPQTYMCTSAYIHIYILMNKLLKFYMPKLCHQNSVQETVLLITSAAFSTHMVIFLWGGVQMAELFLCICPVIFLSSQDFVSLTIVYRVFTSSTLFLILNQKIHYTSKKQNCGYQSEREGHFKANNKLHAMAKEYHTDFRIVTKSRTDYSKNSLEADELKSNPNKKISAFGTYNKVTVCHLLYKCYHLEQKEIYIKIYMCIISYSQRKL